MKNTVICVHICIVHMKITTYYSARISLCRNSLNYARDTLEIHMHTEISLNAPRNILN